MIPSNRSKKVSECDVLIAVIGERGKSVLAKNPPKIDLKILRAVFEYVPPTFFEPLL
jgi:hypothetical protein